MKATKYLAGLLLALAGQQALAQSSDFEYPVGGWVNNPMGMDESKELNVWIEVSRANEAYPDFGNRRGCGYIHVRNNYSEKDVFYALLTYAGKGMNGNVGSGTYYFNVRTKDGQTGRVGFKKTFETNTDEDGNTFSQTNFEYVAPTGVIADQPFLGEKLVSFNIGNGRYADATPYAENWQDFLETLSLAEPDANIAGFGERTLYVAAHSRLTPGQPVYATPKGQQTINIRERRSATAAKAGELKPGESLLVADEYDGWCQVRLPDRKYAWVNLGVVTLTNDPDQVSTSQPSASTPSSSDFVLGNGKLGPLYLGQSVSSLPQQVAGLYDRFKYEKQEIDNEMEGSWTEEWCHFYKDGKEIFKCFAENRKLSSFVLLEGSQFIKTTPDGFFVGYPARELYSQKRMQWTTYYEGTAFARSGHFEYHIDSRYITNDSPSRLNDIKPGAKICKIVYYSEAAE